MVCGQDKRGRGLDGKRGRVMKRISQRDMLQSEIARLTVELNGQKTEVERLKKHLRWATDTEGTYKCQNCQNLVESEYTNRLFCSYHSEGEYQHETFLDDYCNYFESKKDGE